MSDGDSSSPAAEIGAPRPLAWLLTLAGAIGLVAAFVLTVEKLALVRDPSYVPSCSLNPVLSCGSVMKTPQAEVLGFPNSLLGIVGFGLVLATGAALLGGSRLHRWYWAGLQVGATAGVVFVHWLMFQSLYRIHALCPYCMVVWAVTIPLFLYITIHNLRQADNSLPPIAQRIARAVAEFHAPLLTGWFLTVAALIAAQFWTYWQTLLSR